ncbi:MAG: hypothetical protein PHO89_07060 [Methylacidiphilaceae bacterium]|nr:hypothetical protein [Candidatus Methylacidiphilaceae bacterium]
MGSWRLVDPSAAVDPEPPCHPDLVRLRRVLVVIYWTLIFEGILRKWLLPHFQQVLFFLRDPMVLYAYFLAFRAHAWSRPSGMLVLALFFGLLGALDAFALLLQGELTPVIILYGWRNYFLYIPLAFLIGRVFSAKDMDRILRWTVLLALPIAPLGVLQAISPLSSPINKGFGEGENALENGGVYGDILRATGIFYSVPGHILFIGSCIAFLLMIWTRRRAERPLAPRWLPLVGLAALFNLFVSGSRTAFWLATIVVLGTLAAEAGAGRVGKVVRIGFAVGLLGSCAGIATVAFFPEVVDAMVARWTMTSDINGEGGVLSKDRVANELFHFVSILDEVPVMGYGLGIAGNGARRLGMEVPFDAEGDWDRHIVELGSVLGLCYIVYRWILVAWLGWLCWRASLRYRSSEPMMLYVFILPTLFIGQIPGQGTVHGYCWIFVGFCLASYRCAEEKAKAGRSPFLPPHRARAPGTRPPSFPVPKWTS